jgi:DNA-binding CsgD family transcriptional regulator
MKHFVLFLALLATSASFSQSLNIDSLGSNVDNESRLYHKTIALERALTLMAIENVPDHEVLHLFDVDLFSKRMLLMLNAYPVKRNAYHSNWDEILEGPDERNPYALFFIANKVFYQGDTRKSLTLYRKAGNNFIEKGDSMYASSAYNNIGAVQWHLGALDSALFYFIQSRNYTAWYNETLEANILAIANTLGDSILSREQIDIIHSNNPKSTNGIFLNNAYHYYERFEVAKLDSLKNFINESFKRLSEVPDELFPVIVANQWHVDSLAIQLLSMYSNAYYDEALDALAQSPAIGHKSFSDSVLTLLTAKSTDTLVSELLALHIGLDSLKRVEIAHQLRDKERSQLTESMLRLRRLSNQYKSGLQEKDDELKKVLYLGVFFLLIALLVVIFLQRQKIKQTLKSRELALENKELENQKATLAKELHQVRKSIQTVAHENMRKMDMLKKVIIDASNDTSTTSAILEDLNIIRVHQEGMTRFKIKTLCEDLNSEAFDALKPILNSKEIQILKLMVLEFRSKEIAALMDVTPQYVNNQRHKIRSLIQDQEADFEKFIDSLRESLRLY